MCVPQGPRGNTQLSISGLMCLLTLQSCPLTKYRRPGEWGPGVVGSAVPCRRQTSPPISTLVPSPRGLYGEVSSLGSGMS